MDQTHASVTNFSSPSGEENNIYLELQLTDALTRIPLIVKQNNVFLGVEYYDALNYKLLCINVTNSLQLKELITTRSLNSMLNNINKIGFASTKKSLILLSIKDANTRSSDIYTDPL